MAEKKIVISEEVTVKDFAGLLQVDPITLMKGLMRNGVMITVNQLINFDIAQLIGKQYGYDVQKADNALDDGLIDSQKSSATDENLQQRSPIVAIMGHVDHGKTTLLDYIRKTRIAASEKGGITQHIGAYKANYNRSDITFLDTPGHEAFTMMRARGSVVTDIAILVVAADDGVMPQTIESINHIKAANIPVIVAINKTDKADTDVEKVKRQLSENDILVEEWGGDVIQVPLSALKGTGINDLLDNILLVAEVEDYKAKFDGPATGVVIESRLDKKIGPVASVIIKNGILNIGDTVVAGSIKGKVKAIRSFDGSVINSARPSDPVEILGFDDIPVAGDVFKIVENEKDVRKLLSNQTNKSNTIANTQNVLTLDSLKGTDSEKYFNFIIKSDVQGTLEALKSSFENLAVDNNRVKIVHTGTGSITESDVMLASTLDGFVVGFNVLVSKGALIVAKKENVKIIVSPIIYKLIEDGENILKDNIEVEIKEILVAKAEVLNLFKGTKNMQIAGVNVLEGIIKKGSTARIMRDDNLVTEAKIGTLRRFQDNVDEVAMGMECGISIANFKQFQVGDVIEIYEVEK